MGSWKEMVLKRSKTEGQKRGERKSEGTEIGLDMEWYMGTERKD